MKWLILLLLPLNLFGAEQIFDRYENPINIREEFQNIYLGKSNQAVLATRDPSSNDGASGDLWVNKNTPSLWLRYPAPNNWKQILTGYSSSNIILNQNTLQSGATFYVSSGSIGTSTDYASFDSDGDLTFSGTADYLVKAGGKYAFRYASSENYGLYFDDSAVEFQFKTSDSSNVLRVHADSG